MKTEAWLPFELTLRAYQMGFGDCFLLTFHYPARGAKKEFERHVLIDFGSAAAPKALDRICWTASPGHRNECGGKLHVVVATHRHRSAVGGFIRTPQAVVRQGHPRPQPESSFSRGRKTPTLPEIPEARPRSVFQPERMCGI